MVYLRETPLLKQYAGLFYSRSERDTFYLYSMQDLHWNFLWTINDKGWV